MEQNACAMALGAGALRADGGFCACALLLPLPRQGSGERPLRLNQGTAYACQCVWIVCGHICTFVGFPSMDELETLASQL